MEWSKAEPFGMWPIIPPCNNRYEKSAVGIVTGRGKPNCVDNNLL
jgi:hypothetical protein